MNLDNWICCFLFVGFQSIDTRHAWEMWPVPLVTAGLVGDLPGHGIILTTWNPAPEPPEGLVTEGKGLPETMPMARTCYAAAAAVRTISTLACGTCASVTSKFVNQSWSWDKLVIRWDKRGSARCRVFSGLHSGARTVRASGNCALLWQLY